MSDRVDDFTLTDETGTPRTLSELLADGPDRVQWQLRGGGLPLPTATPSASRCSPTTVTAWRSN